jgi:predicted deacylase
MLATIAVPIVIYTLMPQLHRLRVRLIGARNMLRDQPGVTEDDVTMRAIVQDSYGPAERWRIGRDL